MKRFPLPGEPLRMLPLVLISLFVVMAAVDAMIAFQPTVLRPLRDGWQHWVGKGWVPPAWSSLFATGVAVAGIAIAAAVLSTFVRGVQTAPYVWLAPVVAGSGVAVMAGLPVELPLPLSTPGFALVSGVLLLGGGALLQPDSFGMRFAASFALAAPLLWLTVGYSQAGSASLHAHGAVPLLVVLAMTTLAMIVLSLGTAPGAFAGSSDGVSEQLLELLERAKASEARALHAERQLAEGGMYNPHAAPRLASDDDELELLRARGPGHGLLWSALLFLVASVVTGYFALYMPLQNRLAVQHKLTQTHDEQHVKALAALRLRFDEERQTLEAQLRQAQAVQAPTAMLPAEPAANADARPEAAAAAAANPERAKPPAAPAPVAETTAPTPAAKKPAEAEAPRDKAKLAAKATPASAAHRARPAPAASHKKAHTEKLAAKAGAAKSASQANKSHEAQAPIDDDPIGGL